MDVLMPQLGETVAEGTVSTWHKEVGDRVEADEILLDVETDKVSMEIPAPSAGRIKKILVAAGETVEVGTVLAVIETPAEAEAGAEGAASAEAAPASVERVAEPASANVSSLGARESVARPPAASSPPAQVVALARESDRRLSPAVRRLLAESGLDAAEIEGTGRSGRITRRDVLARIEQGATDVSAELAALEVDFEPDIDDGIETPVEERESEVPVEVVAAAASEGATLEPFNRIRRLTAEHMVRSKATSPHVLQAVEVDFSAVERARQSVRETWRAKHGYSLTFLPFIAHAVCRALKAFPHVNASVEGDALLLHPHVNLAIAVDLGPGGLLTPVVRSAEALSLPELAAALQDLAGRARQKRLGPDDLAGGTYTLSNSGTFGTLITAPIINQPQVAILSVDGIRKRPVVIEQDGGDAIAIRPVGILAQSFDHRAIDGAYSAAFLSRVRALLEETHWVSEL